MSEFGQQSKPMLGVSVSASDQRSGRNSMVTRFRRSSEVDDMRERKKGSVVTLGDAKLFSAKDAASFYGEVVGRPIPAAADSVFVLPSEAGLGPRWALPKSLITDFQRSNANSATQTIKTFSDSDVGFKLLKKSGWQEGTGLGVSAQGRLDPVETEVKLDRRGIGAEKKVKRMMDGKANKLREEKSITKEKKVLSRKLRNAQIKEKCLQEEEFNREFRRQFWPENV